MFLMYAPEGNPLYWFQQTFGNHFIGFPVLIAAVVVSEGGAGGSDRFGVIKGGSDYIEASGKECDI